jgi:hypothetical protein
MLFLRHHGSRVLGAGVFASVALFAGSSHASPATPYVWDQGDGPTVMMSAEEGMCFLTGMEGDYQGTGENVRIENDTGYFVLNGTSQQNSVKAWAACVRWSEFPDLPNSSWTQSSTSSSCVAGVSAPWPFASSPNVTFPSDIVLASGYDFCFLSQIGGGLDSNTSASTYYDGTNWHLAASEGQPSATMNVAGRCMGLGASHPLWTTPVATWRVGDAPISLLPDSEGICAITSVHGAFRGDGEIAQIIDQDGAWVLWGTSQQANTSVGVQCVYYDQIFVFP